MHPCYHLTSKISLCTLPARTIASILLPFNAGTASEPSKNFSENSVQSAARRLLPQYRHEDFHRPSSLWASNDYVLLLVIAFFNEFMVIIRVFGILVNCCFYSSSGYFVTVQPTASLLLKSGSSKVCLQQRAGFLFPITLSYGLCSKCKVLR